ncbi:glutathione peroxidase [Cellulophaga sp. Hel_I_12]|uniref:glutathione peroxidase n=1 Tax=Cellulophaga sp. Hel_I_12 TaxID=1249972 RepID=UPI000645EC31|nr:glutathione peroxidase [Cellulophaga sp. Hel_I_12]
MNFLENLKFTTSKGKDTIAPKESIYTISINDIHGTPLVLEKFKGKYILFVNVASECGFTSQYSDLQKLYKAYQEKLVIIGAPCNQFGGQEPGDENQITSFCELNFGVSFPLTEKLAVKGPSQHPLYQWLTDKNKNGKKSSTVKWNFQKYLVDDTGHLVDVFYSITKPLSTKITKYFK